LVVRKDNQGGRGGEISIVNYAGGGSNGIGNEAALNFGLENSTYDADNGNAQIKSVTTAANAATDIVISNWSGSSFEERLRILSDGKVLIGHTSNIFNYKLAVFGTDGGNSGISASRFSNNSSPSSLILSKSRGTSIGSYTIVQDNDEVGMIDFRGADGSDNMSKVAEIKASIDGTPGSNDMPGRLTFHTTADGASSTTERLRITSGGRVGIGEDSPDSMLHIKAANDRAAIRLENTYPSPNNVWELTPSISGVTNTGFCIRDVTDGANRLVIDGSGNIGFNRSSGLSAGGAQTQTATATPSRIVFNNHYSNGYTDASLKVYLFNDGNTRHGFTSGPSHDLQYHCSGAATSKHTFYTQNNKDMHIEAGQVYKPRQYQFLVESNGSSINGSSWSKLTGLSIDLAHCTGISDGTHWSNTNQRFTVPVTGTYKFFFGGWSSINSGSNNDRYAICFRINGGLLKYIFGGSYSGVDTPLDGASIVYKLSANDYIELWYYSALSGTWGGGHRVFWGGYLLG